MEGGPGAQSGVISSTRGRTATTPRLYLVTPRLDDAARFADELAAVLAAGDVAAVLLRLADADERSLVNRAKAVAAAVQGRDIALLLDGRPELVGRTGADGAHLTGAEAFAAAVVSLKPDRIAGVGGLHGRHDAMLAGEQGADYVMFGEPEPAVSHRSGRDHGNDRRPPFDAVIERLKWWAELVEVPCVGYAANSDEIRPLAAAGADFVALGDWIWTHPDGAAAAVAAAHASLAAAAP
jgi:thiamine-phosphate pyrophosphorylase